MWIESMPIILGNAELLPEGYELEVARHHELPSGLVRAVTTFTVRRLPTGSLAWEVTAQTVLPA